MRGQFSVVGHCRGPCRQRRDHGVDASVVRIGMKWCRYCVRVEMVIDDAAMLWRPRAGLLRGRQRQRVSRPRRAMITAAAAAGT